MVYLLDFESRVGLPVASSLRQRDKEANTKRQKFKKSKTKNKKTKIKRQKRHTKVY